MEELIFKQPKWWKSAWETYHGERLVASLTVTSWSWMRAEAQIGEQRYELEYRMWTNQIFIHDASGAQIAEAKPRNWWNTAADLKLAGKHYALAYHWGGSHTATDDRNVKVVQVKPSWWSCSAVATIQNSANENELLLALLLFYRIQVTNMSTATIIPIMTAVVVSS